jgi:hypothetical protein
MTERDKLLAEMVEIVAKQRSLMRGPIGCSEEFQFKVLQQLFDNDRRLIELLDNRLEVQ